MSLIPYAVCRLPSIYLPGSNVGFSHGSHGSCAGFAEREFASPERDLHHGGPACTLSSPLGGRLRYCCYYDCCRSPAAVILAARSSVASCKYFPRRYNPIMSFRCLDVSIVSPIIAGSQGGTTRARSLSRSCNEGRSEIEMNRPSSRLGQRIREREYPVLFAI